MASLSCLVCLVYGASVEGLASLPTIAHPAVGTSGLLRKVVSGFQKGKERESHLAPPRYILSPREHLNLSSLMSSGFFLSP